MYPNPRRGDGPSRRPKGRPEIDRSAWTADDMAAALSAFLTSDCQMTAAQIRKVALRLLCVCEPKGHSPSPPAS